METIDGKPVLTEKMLLEEIDKFAEAAANGILNKPSHLQELRKRIESMIHAHKVNGVCEEIDLYYTSAYKSVLRIIDDLEKEPDK